MHTDIFLEFEFTRFHLLFLIIIMLRHKHRKANNAATLPFHIRNNFRRLPNRIYILSGNDGSEKMLQDFNDRANSEEHNCEDINNDGDNLEHQSDDDDDYLEYQSDDDGDYLEYQSDDDGDYLEYQSDSNDSNEEGSDAYMIQSSENDDDNDHMILLESDEDYVVTSSNNEEVYDTGTSSEEKLFVDAALAEDKLPSFDVDFAPYFQDLTTAALFCWIHKHNISTNAYEDLVDIIMRPEFNRDHIVKNIRRFLS